LASEGEAGETMTSILANACRLKGSLDNSCRDN
jgi:hypothetical protein